MADKTKEVIGRVHQSRDAGRACSVRLEKLKVCSDGMDDDEDDDVRDPDYHEQTQPARGILVW